VVGGFRRGALTPVAKVLCRKIVLHPVASCENPRVICLKKLISLPCLRSTGQTAKPQFWPHFVGPKKHVWFVVEIPLVRSRRSFGILQEDAALSFKIWCAMAADSYASLFR
jgi:hypothetical protein